MPTYRLRPLRNKIIEPPEQVGIFHIRRNTNQVKQKTQTNDNALIKKKIKKIKNKNKNKSGELLQHQWATITISSIRRHIIHQDHPRL